MAFFSEIDFNIHWLGSMDMLYMEIYSACAANFRDDNYLQ